MACYQIQGLFYIGWTAIELLALQAKVKALILEGKTTMTGNIGSKSFGKQFPLPLDQVLIEISAALRKLDPVTYGVRVRRTIPVFSAT